LRNKRLLVEKRVQYVAISQDLKLQFVKIPTIEKVIPHKKMIEKIKYFLVFCIFTFLAFIRRKGYTQYTFTLLRGGEIIEAYGY